jgi:hypothetical protein
MDCLFFLINLESLDNAIKSVVRAFSWKWQDIESLYLDDTDFRGLLYWYEDIKEVNKPKEK